MVLTSRLTALRALAWRATVSLLVSSATALRPLLHLFGHPGRDHGVAPLCRMLVSHRSLGSRVPDPGKDGYQVRRDGHVPDAGPALRGAISSASVAPDCAARTAPVCRRSCTRRSGRPAAMRAFIQCRRTVLECT